MKAAPAWVSISRERTEAIDKPAQAFVDAYALNRVPAARSGGH